MSYKIPSQQACIKGIYQDLTQVSATTANPFTLIDQDFDFSDITESGKGYRVVISLDFTGVANKQLLLYLGGQTIMDTTALPIQNGGDMIIEVFRYGSKAFVRVVFAPINSAGSFVEAIREQLVTTFFADTTKLKLDCVALSAGDIVLESVRVESIT